MRTATSSGLHRLAVATAGCTLILVFAGGLVTTTGSGLAVPDWPLSYGSLMPRMVGGIVFEHSHRLIAGAVATLATGLMFWAWRREPRRWVRRLAFVAWVTVLTQALLGGLTVLLLLPTAVSVAHGGIAQIFFALVCMVAVVTSPRWATARRGDAADPRVRLLSILAVVCVYVQTLIGAWMRHDWLRYDGAGLAIPDFPLAYGGLIPPLTADGLPGINAVRNGVYGYAYLATIGPVLIHFAHRAWATVVVLVIAGMFATTVRRHRDSRALTGLAGLILGLVGAQVLLGGLTIWTAKGVIPTTAHVTLGSVILASCVVFAAVYRRCTEAAPALSAASGRAAHA